MTLWNRSMLGAFALGTFLAASCGGGGSLTENTDDPDKPDTEVEDDDDDDNDNGDDNDDDGNKEPSLTGTWAVTESFDLSQCQSENQTVTYAMEIAQDGRNLTVRIEGAQLQGTFENGVATWDGDIELPEDDATLRYQNVRLELDEEGNTLTGESSWTLEFENGESCNGTSQISAELDGQTTDPGTPTTGDDPLLAEQWHLENTGQEGGTPGEDARVLAAWQEGVSGSGVLVAVVDDGLEIGHVDLEANVRAGLSFDYTDGDDDPSTGDHGTACAGLIASTRDNGTGGAGVAPAAELVGYNILANPSDENFVDGMTRNASEVSVSSNSWGAPDNQGIPQPSTQSWKLAVEEGLEQGRGGRGTVYAWAAGNGFAEGHDFSTLDGQASYHGVMAVAAVGDDGVRANYSEPGANLWVSAPSMGRANHGLTTTDRSGAEGYNTGDGQDLGDVDYTNSFNGTSAATPVVAGVASLVLETAPNLSWRDVRQVIAKSARRNDPANENWITNAAGHDFNLEYGFGVVDAAAAVALAKTWQPLGEYRRFETGIQAPGTPIPDADEQGLELDVQVASSGISKLEFVDVIFGSADHTFTPDLRVQVTSPSGTSVLLIGQHETVDPTAAFVNHRFGCAALLDESADGTWKVQVVDAAAQDTGSVTGLGLVLYGN